jgi:hypothetical protein
MLQQSVTFSLPSHTCHRPRNEAPSLNRSIIMRRITVFGPVASRRSVLSSTENGQTNAETATGCSAVSAGGVSDD